MKQSATVKRLYDAAQVSDFHKTPKTSGTADYELNTAGAKLRDYARWLDENSDITIGALDVLVNSIVGAGIQVEPQVINRKGEPVAKLNEKIRDLWQEWKRKPDITGEVTLRRTCSA